MNPQTDAPVKLAAARAIIDELVEVLRPACERIEVAGSVRRGKPEVKDAEVVITPTPELLPLTDDLIQYGRAQYALYGDSRTKRWGQNYRGLLYRGIKCELFMTTAESWGYQFWLRTGPGDANAYIMRWLGLSHVNAPVRFQEGYGWYSQQWRHNGKKWLAPDRRRLRITSEADLFAVLGMPYLPPAERTEMRYKLLTNKRHYLWPDYSPYFAIDPVQTMMLTVHPAEHFFEPSDVDESAKEHDLRWSAERQFNRWLMTTTREQRRLGGAYSWDAWKAAHGEFYYA